MFHRQRTVLQEPSFPLVGMLPTIAALSVSFCGLSVITVQGLDSDALPFGSETGSKPSDLLGSPNLSLLGHW